MIKSVMDIITPSFDLGSEYQYFWSSNPGIYDPYKPVYYREHLEFYKNLFRERPELDFNYDEGNQIAINLEQHYPETGLTLFLYKIKKEHREKLEQSYRERDNKYIANFMELKDLLFIIDNIDTFSEAFKEIKEAPE